MKTKRSLIQIWLLCAAVLLQAVTCGAQPVTKIAAGDSHSLFLKSDGSLWAMGYNFYGQLGDGTYNNTNRPEQIVASNVTAIAAGDSHSLFLKSDGSLWAMGYNAGGGLGDGTHNNTNRPEMIMASNVTAIAGGGSHSLFLKSDGSLWAMGYNFYGQLGDGTHNNTNRPEQIVASNVTAIAAGYYDSLFLKSDGSLWAMGDNAFGQFGNGTKRSTNQPEQILSSNITAIAAGDEHSLFLKSDGSLWATGDNDSGQLGDGSYNETYKPEQILSSNVTAIAAGYYDSLFLKSDGSLWAMGNNLYGQLGDGTTNNADLPEQIVAGNVTAIAAGFDRSLFLKSDGSLWAMGDNFYGQLGDGTYSNTNLPEKIVSPSTLPGFAAAYIWTTLAGIGISHSTAGVRSDGVIIGNSLFNVPSGVAVDSAGNVYVADTGNSAIREVTPAGVVTTLAGLAGTPGTNDGTGSTARFYQPQGVAVDSAGNVYVADSGNNTIRKVTPAGVVTTLAGLAGTPGANDGTGSAARFYWPGGVAVDSAGNVYVADTLNNTIRKVTPAGVVTTLAGLAGTPGANNGTGNTARFFLPQSVAVDSAGNVYVADTDNDTIRKVTPAGVVTTLAGFAGTPGANDGTGSTARFFQPQGVAVDSAGNIYVADTDNDTIRKVTPAGVVMTLAGLAGTPGGNNGTGSAARFYWPGGVAVDSAGNVYVADSGNSTIRKVTPAGVVTTLAAGSVGTSSEGSADGRGSTARFSYPGGVAMDTNGNIYVADIVNSTIREVTPAGVVTTLAGLAGAYGTNDGTGSAARFNGPWGVAVNSAGNVYVADTDNCTIRKVTPAGVVTTLAGLAGAYGTNDGTGSTAYFFKPQGVVVDSAGNVYVADSGNNTIRKVTPAGVVTTLAGLAGAKGTNDGTGSAARFDFPGGVAMDSATNLYVADSYNNTIRKLTPVGTNWIVSTIAGLAGNEGSADGMNSTARFNDPWGVAVDSATNLYVADSGNNTIRKMARWSTNWMVRTIGGVAAVSGSADGEGSAAFFADPVGIAVDSAGNLYVADCYNNTIRKGVATAYVAANEVSYSQPAMNSSLAVTLLPPEANGQWRFPWELGWRTNGQTASNLVAGNYPVEFRTLPGWLAIPLSLTVAVPTNSLVAITNQYYPTLSTVDTNNGGTLTVTLGLNPPSGAGWGFLGNSPPWYPSGHSTNLVAGTYLIDFAPVSGRVTPPNLSVQVLAGRPTLLAENYLLAQSAPGGVLLPTPVPSANISDLTDYPFGFNGQLETDVGYGSGVAVQANVVLTAAHLVFNDQTLSYVSQVYWYFQEEAGGFEPDPLPARGWFVLSGYAAQRTNDLQTYAPDTSTPQSRNLDVAALYFLSPVAGGGYGGYLPSDESPNPWLISTAEKMLVGYPVDGSQFGDTTIVPGKMYQIGPQPYPLTLATNQVTNQQEVYTASWFLSYPGNSGGPVYVQLNGYYYPAGVYLGTLYNGVTPYASVVRAINSEVVNLIAIAANLNYIETNSSTRVVIQSLGGVATMVFNQVINDTNMGYLQCQLAPSAAVQAGAGWRLQGEDTNYCTGTNCTEVVSSTNAVVVEFKPIAGWNTPTNQTVTVQPGQISSPTAFYTVVRGPTIRIVSPVSSQRVSNAVFTVTGMATGSVAVASVYYSLNGSAWINASTTNNWANWTAAVNLIAGTNIFLAYAVDIGGDISATTSVSFQYVVNAPLQVQMTGLGSLSPNYSNAVLAIGTNYTMTASPGSGFMFTNWTGGITLPLAVLTNGATLQFMMQSNLVLQANFIDTSKPTLSITNLTTGQRVSNAVFTVKGTASDNWQVSNVWCQLNGLGWSNAVPANGWTNWTAGVTFVPGTNVVQALAVDTTGNKSTTNSVGIQFVATNRLGVRALGLGTISPNYSNAWLEIGRNYSMTASAGSGFMFTNWMISTNWLGGVKTNNATVQFMMESNLTLQVSFVDVTKPTLSITNLTTGQRVSNAVFTVRGKASDNWQVSNVWYQLNDAGWSNAVSANNWTNWSAAVNLIAGTNTIQAYAVDIGGNLSATNSVSFVAVLSTVLTVNTNGSGTVSPNYNGVSLQIWATYSMTATAGAGFAFTNWTGGITLPLAVLTNGATLQFVMQSNLVLQANFIDTSKPTLSITNLTAGQRLSNAVFTVRGTASDNWQVSNVWYQLNDAGWSNAVSANNWTNWSGGVTFVPGTNVVQALAVDTTGNKSTTNGVSIQFVVTNRLGVRALGLGTISPNYSNAWLEIGRNYSMAATPASGFNFTNWVISTDWLGGVKTNNAAVQFMMESNLTLQVSFVDVTKPTVTITVPTAGQKMTNALANVKGMASDNWGVTNVWYQLNSNAWSLATTTNCWTNWSVTLTLMTGTNTVKAYAMDLGGNLSVTNSVSFVSSNAFMLQLAFTTVQPLATNGLNFALQLSPGLNGHVQFSTDLVNWVTLTNFVGTNATLNFRDATATNYNQRFYRAVVP